MQTRLITTESGDSLNERRGSYLCKEGIEWKINQKENGLGLQYKEPHQKKFSAPLNLYPTVLGHYIIKEELDTWIGIFHQTMELNNSSSINMEVQKCCWKRPIEHAPNAVSQKGGATNIFATFCSLISLSDSR